MSNRTLSTKAKVITGIIYALAAIMLVTVIYMNVNSNKEDDSTNTTITTTTAVETNSDKYANIEPAYAYSEVLLQETTAGSISAYVNDVKAEDYTGVAQADDGWYFVREGDVDYSYNGIAGNELGNWYIVNGKVDFDYTGTFTVNGTTYNIEQGKATLQ